MELYDTIKIIMRQKRFSTGDLVKETGLKQSTIYHIMKNKTNFNNAKLSNILKILDILEIKLWGEW